MKEVNELISMLQAYTNQAIQRGAFDKKQVVEIVNIENKLIEAVKKLGDEMEKSSKKS